MYTYDDFEEGGQPIPPPLEGVVLVFAPVGVRQSGHLEGEVHLEQTSRHRRLCVCVCLKGVKGECV